MRVGGDGVVLAANDAALALFGADKASQVLGTSLTGFVAASHRDIWLGFVAKVTAGSAHSLECVLNDVSGTERNVILHGVPLLDHADGVRSVLLSIRDNGAIRRMEAALHESEQLRQHSAMPNPEDTQRIEDLQATITELQAQRDQLERTVAELPRLQQLLKQGRAYLQDMQTRLAAATKERDALAEQLSERATSHDDAAASRGDLEQSLAAAIAQRDALATQLIDQNAANQQLRAEEEAKQASLVDTYERDLAALRQHLDERTTERADLQKRLSEAESRCAHLQQEREQAEHHVTSHVQRIDALEGRLARALHDHEQLTAEVAKRVQEREHLSAEMAKSVQEREHLAADMAKRVQEHDAAMASAEERHRAEIAGVRHDLESANAQLVQERSTIETLNAALADERATLTTANGRLAEAHSNIDTISARLADEQAKLDAASRSLADTQARVNAAETSLGEARSGLEAAHASLAEERGTIDKLKGEVAGALSERDGVSTELTALQAAHAQQAREHESHRDRLQQEVAAAIANLNEAEKTLSDNRLELQSMDAAIRNIEPLAAAGRVAAESARELLAAIGDIDARTACLVSESPTDVSSREQIEQLRADAVRAASLARQILHASRLAQAEERHADSA